MARKRIYDIYYHQFHASISAESFSEACEIFKRGECIIKPAKNARFKKSCFSFEAKYGTRKEEGG